MRADGLLPSFIHAPYTIDASASPTNHAAELTRVRGLKSAAVRELLPRASDEAIHRDFFVLS